MLTDTDYKLSGYDDAVSYGDMVSGCADSVSGKDYLVPLYSDTVPPRTDTMCSD